MRVAIVEWWPRICGATDWAVHLSKGFVHHGHQAELITFSKSGRQLAAWGIKQHEWKAHKIKDAVDVLNSYDLVILSDIASRAPEHNPEKKGIPWYVEAMEQINTPWTTMIHDGAYTPRLNAVIEPLLRSPAFMGKLITTRVNEAEERIAPHAPHPINWVVYPYLPYDFTKVQPYTGPRTTEIILVGRMTSNKGQDVLMHLFRRLKTNVHFWGTGAYGKPSPAWRTWELGVAEGYDQVSFPLKRKDKIHMTHPECHKFYTGYFALGHEGRTIEYHEAYDELSEIDWTPLLSVGLSNDGLTGTLEYGVLDTVAAGCVAIVPNHQLAYTDRYDGVFPTLPFSHGSYSESKGQVKAGRNNDMNEDEIVERINKMWAMSHSTLKNIAKMQRQELMLRHQPRVVVKKILEGLEG